MRAPAVVHLPPALKEHLGFLQLVEDLPLSSSLRSLPLPLSMYPLYQGLPGSMNRVRFASSPSQCRILWPVNSGAIGVALVWWTGDGQGNSTRIEPARLRVGFPRRYTVNTLCHDHTVQTGSIMTRNVPARVQLSS